MKNANHHVKRPMEQMFLRLVIHWLNLFMKLLINNNLAQFTGTLLKYTFNPIK